MDNFNWSTAPIPPDTFHTFSKFVYPEVAQRSAEGLVELIRQTRSYEPTLATIEKPAYQRIITELERYHKAAQQREREENTQNRNAQPHPYADLITLATLASIAGLGCLVAKYL
ncbi:hypothetical protein HYV86_02965 [Candidatus Woesearchaeota archaeon]|nr:hypothetical protein [Candidatus Woesearchaeota archaeon]